MTSRSTQWRRRLIRVGLLALALGIAVSVSLLILRLTGGFDAPALPGLAVDTGPTAWLLPVIGVIGDAMAVATVGFLLAAAFFAPGLPWAPSQSPARPPRRLLLTPIGFGWVRAASWTATAWAVVSGVGLVLTASDLLGIRPTEALRAPILFDTARSVTQGRMLIWTCAITVVLAVACRGVRTVNGAALACIGALVAVTPIAFAGHAAGAGNHQLAVSAQILHVVPVTLWLGGLLALALGSRRIKPDRAAALRRYSTLAAVCLLLVAVSGVVSLSVGLRSWSDLLDTAYGQVALLKIAVLLAAGALGWLHRARSLPAVAAGRSRVFGRIAAVELGVLAVGLGAAVGLAATPAPRVEDTGDAAASLLGYPMPDVLTAAQLFTRWLVDPLIVTVAGLAVAVYALAVHRIRRRGERWSWWRLTSWTAGWAVIVFVTCSGVATYAPVLLSVHLAQHLTLAVIAPILLTLGGPVTLALRGTRPSPDPAWRGTHEWTTAWIDHPITRMMAHPLMALGMYAGGLYAMYFTGLYELSLRSHAVHLLMMVHLVGAGYFFFWLLVGVDAPLLRLGFAARTALLGAAAVGHAGLGFPLTRGNQILAGDWFAALSRDWGWPLLIDQRLGGEIVWLFAAASSTTVLCVMLVRHRRERYNASWSSGIDPDATLPSTRQLVGEHVDLGDARRRSEQV